MAGNPIRQRKADNYWMHFKTAVLAWTEDTLLDLSCNCLQWQYLSWPSDSKQLQESPHYIQSHKCNSNWPSFQPRDEHLLLPLSECRYDLTWLLQLQKPGIKRKDVQETFTSTRKWLLFTQQEPQDPWSLISCMVGQSGHCSRASNASGIAWLLNNWLTFFNGGMYKFESGCTPIIWVRTPMGKFLPKFRPA